MEIFLMILRTLLLTIGSVLALIYFIMQFWQPVPASGVRLKGKDWFFYFVVSALFGFGLNNEWGLLAFVPLLLIHVIFQFFIQRNKVYGGGRWMEIEWRKLTPKGFKLPPEMRNELGRLPGDVHFLFPRFASLLAMRFVVRSVRKNASKMPQKYNAKQGDAIGMVENVARNVAKLDSGKTEQLSLPFGVLKITRL